MISRQEPSPKRGFGFRPPRLLPLTMAVMLALLVLKTTGLVRVAFFTPVEERALAAVEGSVVPMAHAAPSAANPASSAASANGAAPNADTNDARADAKPGPVVDPDTPVNLAKPEEPQVSAAERHLLLDLRERKKSLDQREAALGAREATLAAAERRISARVDELKTLQDRLVTLDAARKQREESSWAGLVKLYETMRPRDAAVIFNDLDMNVLLPVVDRMKDAKAAAVLAAMQPEKARQITTQLAAMRTRETGGGN